MAELRDWDISAANNTDAPPDGAPEGMLPSAVNNTMREMMAVMARYYATEGETVATLAALQALSGRNNQKAVLLGRASAGDGGGGVFRFDASDLSTEVAADELTSSQGDGGIYVAPASDRTGASGAWVRITTNNIINLKWYGAKGDDSTDNTNAINAAVAAAQGKVLYAPAGTYRYSSTIYLGHDLSFIGDGGDNTIFKPTHSGVGMATKLQSGQSSFTRNQTYKDFSIQANENTTYAFWVVWSLYNRYEGINVIIPESAGSNVVGFRLGGRVYLNTFDCCVCDTIEETSTKHGGRAWWIGNGYNEESSSFAATNNNTFINCRAIRANVGFDLDCANGCTMIGTGPEACTTAGLRIKGGFYNNVYGPWLELGDVIFENGTPGDGSGGTLPAIAPNDNNLTAGYAVSNMTVTSGRNNTVSGGQINNLTIGADSFGFNLKNVEIQNSITDNGTFSSLEYFFGGVHYRKKKAETFDGIDEQTSNSLVLMNLLNGDFLRSHRLQPMQLSAERGLLLNGGVPTLTINKVSSAPSAPATDQGVLYFDESGGKIRLMVRFPTGAAQQISIEP